MTERLIAAARAVVQRWNSIDWMAPHTADLIRELGAAADALAAQPAAEPTWLPISQAPTDGTPVRLYAQGGGFYDADFNPSGSVEGHCTDGVWSGAFWDGHQDTWYRRDGIVPTHFQYLPAPPEPLGDTEGADHE